MTAHTVDEYVPVEDLIDLAAATAITAMRWCGVVEKKEKAHLARWAF